MRHLRVTAMLSTTSFALHLSEQWAAAGRETGKPSHLNTVLGGGEPGMQQREVRPNAKEWDKAAKPEAEAAVKAAEVEEARQVLW